MNKPRLLEVTEKGLIEFVQGNPKYQEGTDKLIYFDKKRQLLVVKNQTTDDIVSIVRRKTPKAVLKE